MKNKAALLTLVFMLCVQLGFAQSRTVSGVVTSAETGETLPGVAVIEKDTRNGTTTDFEGRFSITVSAPNATLVFQAIGMEDKEVVLGTEDFINVQLSESTEQLEEVVITALGAEREKRSLGFTTSSIEGDELTKGADRSALNSLQGKVPGVNITSSGSPGSSSRIVIRGGQSLTQGIQPLFVIDGVPIFNNAATSTSLDGGFDFGNGANAINPEDIENVSILKGASATALYGSRAANGVVLITTKKGRVTDKGKNFGISYAGDVSFSNPLKLPTLQNDFGQGWDGVHYLDENGSWGPRFDGEERVWGRVVDNSQLLKTYEPLEDNLKDFFETGVAYKNSVAFTGGDQNGTFYVSFSNINSDGIYPTDVDTYNRNTVALRGSKKSGIFNFSGSFNYSDTKTSFVPTGQGPTVYNNLMQIPRDISIVDMEDYESKFYDLDNYFTSYGVINPYYTLNEFGSKYRGNKFFGGLETQVELTTWANLVYRFGFDYGTDRYNTWEAIIAPTPGSPNAGSSIEDPGSVRERLFTQRQFNHDILLNTDFDLTNDLRLDGTLGMNINDRSWNDLDAIVNGLSIPGFYSLNNGTNSPTVVEDEYSKRYLGFFALASFDFRNYLFLDISARQDYSSTLPLDDNGYFYWGANASIVFSDIFDMTSEFFNYGKLRIGYGTTGNDAPVYALTSPFIQKSVYQPFRTYDFPVNGVNGFTISNRGPSIDLQPEITSEFEIGGELRFFTGRLTLDVTYYNRITEFLILDVPSDPASGYTISLKNTGEIQNQGIEALANVQILRGDDLGGFTWDFSVNFSNNQNTVLELEGVEKVELGGLSTIGFVAVEGEPMGVFEGTVPLKSPDGQIVVDANGVPIQSTEKEFYGDSQYDYIIGITNGFSYKGISLSATLDWREGGLMYSRTADINYFTGNGIKTTYNDRRPFIVPNSVQEVVGADGTSTYVENTTPIDQAHMDDYHRAGAFARNNVIDKSFVKLREVVLSYDIPASVIDNTPFATLSVSVFGRNLFIWTPEDNQFVDPEVTTFGNEIESDFGEFSANPSVRTYGIGLRASF